MEIKNPQPLKALLPSAGNDNNNDEKLAAVRKAHDDTIDILKAHFAQLKAHNDTTVAKDHVEIKLGEERRETDEQTERLGKEDIVMSTFLRNNNDGEGNVDFTVNSAYPPGIPTGKQQGNNDFTVPIEV